jgi:hypothetical protein
VYSLSAGFFFRRRGSASSDDLGGSKARNGTPEVTILFVPVRVSLDKLATGWAEDCDEIILRLCPICKRDSIIGHGRRRKQAHDEHHDWIGIRRGRCAGCGTTFTFLPLFSLPYTHFSVLARCHVLLRRFVERCSWEKAAPKLKDADRVPDSSTMRRWFNGLDCARLRSSFIDRILLRVTHWLTRGDQSDAQSGLLSWLTPVLEMLWPLRL